MREDAQLDLRVVGCNEHEAFRRDESLPDLCAAFGTDRDVEVVLLVAHIGARLAQVPIHAGRPKRGSGHTV